MKPYNVILIAKHPNGIGKSQVGKVVKRNGQIVYQFNKATVMQKTGTLGVHPSVLNYLLEHGIRRIEFEVDGKWLWTTPDEVIEHRKSIRSYSPSHPPHFNLPLEYWCDMPKPEYIHVGARFIEELPWVEPEKLCGQMEMQLG